MGSYALKEKSNRRWKGTILSKSRQNTLKSPSLVHFLTKKRPGGGKGGRLSTPVPRPSLLPVLLETFELFFEGLLAVLPRFELY